MEKLLYRPTEAAEALSVSRAKLYQWLAAGELGSVKLGASRRIPAADLQAFVARLRGEHVAVPTETPTPEQSAAERERSGVAH
jgi:excisionase family DNA binding protein